MDIITPTPLKSNTVGLPSTTDVPKSPSDVLSSLYPAIVQCFSIILLGYVVGRAGWITPNQSKGLNFFTTKVALSALLFSSMASLDWAQVDWNFLTAIFLSKAALFLVAVIFTLALRNSVDIGLAGLLGIFVTKSNDFALGYPIVKAIYGERQPQFLQYIYLIAPISLAILNPIGFTMLEYSKASAQPASRTKCAVVCNVIKQVCTNHLLIMTAAGTAANFIFSHHLPPLLLNLLTTLGQSFSACALFLLGLSIVGKVKNTVAGPVFMSCGLLSFAKLLALPMISMGITQAMGCGATQNATAEYSMFAFLYGTFPTTPTVFIYASYYSVAVDLVASALVLCTVAAAPLMFLSGTLYSMQFFSMDLQKILQDTREDTSILSVISCIVVVLVFLVTSRASRLPHRMVLIIALFQLLLAVGTIIDVGTDSSIEQVTWADYIVYISSTVGELGLSSMTSATALILYFLTCHGLCKAIIVQRWLLFYGIGLPLSLTIILLSFGTTALVPVTSLFQDGVVQSGVMVVVLLANIALSVLVLVARHRRSHTLELIKRDNYHSDCAYSSSDLASTASTSLLTNCGKHYGTCNSSTSRGGGDDTTTQKDIEKCSLLSSTSVSDIEDLVRSDQSASASSLHDDRMCPVKSGCDSTQRKRCAGLLERYDQRVDDKEYQIGKHIGLLILLLICQITGVVFRSWLLFLHNFKMSSLFPELNFIYEALKCGQGLFTCLIFGLDVDYVLLPIKKIFMKVVTKCCGSNSIHSSDMEPSDRAVIICQKFLQHHLDSCRVSIVRAKGRKMDCFSGTALSNWLVDVGLVADDTEACIYADCLLSGGVIRSCAKRRCTTFLSTKHNMYQFGPVVPSSLACQNSTQNLTAVS